MNTKILTTHWQSLPESAIRQLQAEKLRRYLRDVVLPFSPYYREVFHEHRLGADSIRSLDDLRRIPFTTKTDLLNTPEHPQRAKEFIITPDQRVLAHKPNIVLRALVRGRSRVQRELEAEFRPLLLTTTTGRSADPVPFLFTRHDLDNLAVTGRRVFEVCGARSDMRLLNMFPYAPHLAFWQTHYGGEAFGVFVASTGGGKVLGTEGQIRFIRKIQPDVLIGMPTFVYHVLHQAAEENVRCESLKRIVLGGEKVPDGMRRKLISLATELGAREIDVVATYGFTESKMAFAECPRGIAEPSCGYHLYPDFALFEVVDLKTGVPVLPGEPGELVFTPLDARGTVVLRYRTGDLIEGGVVYGPCPNCGRNVPRLVGNISRCAEIREMRMDKIKGTLVDFNELEHMLDDYAHIGAWQIELRKRNDDPLELDELIVHVSKHNGVPEAQLARELNERFVARAEIHPNRIVFHTSDEMRALQGVGSELKERKLVDHRPATARGAGVSPAISAAGVPPTATPTGTVAAQMAAGTAAPQPLRILENAA
ncbi:MAG TPA: AMP-binding protein [Methylomirabilota bacterium]|nr:AMP-binding protein [Methylomirabilota bacterium]